jgi:hypothetical protein
MKKPIKLEHLSLDKPFLQSLIFASKIRAYQSIASLRCSPIGYAPVLACKCGKACRPQFVFPNLSDDDKICISLTPGLNDSPASSSAHHLNWAVIY